MRQQDFLGYFGVVYHSSSFLFARSYLQSILLQSVVSLLSLSAVTALSHPVCPLYPPQTVEHGFPHQPSALSYSPSLQLLAIGTRSGAIKLYPSLYLCVQEGGIYVSCLNLRQVSLMSISVAAKSWSMVHVSTWFRCFFFPHCCSILSYICRQCRMRHHSL